jgi:hydroxyacylglutathione hydrolase
MKRNRKVGTWTTSSGYKIIQVVAGRSNVFLLTNGNINMLVDTSSRRMGPKLEMRLRELKVDHIEYLILTHSHVDHAGNASWIREKFNPVVIIHRKEAPSLTTGDNIIPAGTIFLTRYMVKFFGKKIAPSLRYKPCQYDIAVEHRLDLKDFGFNAYILHTPGHTCGSVSIVVDDEIALVGDTMFGIFRRSVFPPYADDPEEMVRSWGKLLETNCKVFLPSHGTANSRCLVQEDYNRRIKNIRQHQATNSKKFVEGSK